MAQVPLDAVWAMLDECLPGYTARLDDGRPQYFGFPSGPKGSSNPEIEIGHIRKMARYFGILDCAKQEIEQLRH